jgi:hypothetical protein
MRVRRSGPHDVGAGRLVRDWQSGSFGIEWPHDHPVRTYLDGHARGVIGIRIAALSGTGQHAGDAGVRRIMRHRSKVTGLDWYKVSSYAREQKSVSRIVEPLAASADPVIPQPPDC